MFAIQSVALFNGGPQMYASVPILPQKLHQLLVFIQLTERCYTHCSHFPSFRCSTNLKMSALRNFRQGLRLGEIRRTADCSSVKPWFRFLRGHCTPKRNAAHTPTQPTQRGWSIRPCSLLLGTNDRKRSAPACCSNYHRKTKS